jgi:hypothetical protein
MGSSTVRKKTTVYLDAELLTAAKILAARTGRHEYEVIEDALRMYVRKADTERLRTLIDRVASRSALDDDEALELAYAELHAARD